MGAEGVGQHDDLVLVAAFRSSLGTSYRLLQTIEQRRRRPVVSPALALEYESCSSSGIRELGLTLDDVDDFTEYLCGRARLVQIFFRRRPMLPDTDDDRIREVAVRTGSPIATFNVRDFRGSESLGIRTMSPGDLPALMGERR